MKEKRRFNPFVNPWRNGRQKDWKLIAVVDTTGGYLFSIYLGPKSLVRCSCSGELITGLNQIHSEFSCDHIAALYEGRATDNEKIYKERLNRRSEQKRLNFSFAYGGTTGLGTMQMTKPVLPKRTYLVQLTKLGREIFYPRWVELALKQ